MNMYFYIKLIMDRILSLIALIALFPLMLILGIAIKIDSKGPVLFKQRRIGRFKKEFNIFKFRTMKTDAPKNMPTHLLENPDQYITKLGAFLRKSSLDELPQIINIFIGNMSIVGPRPALWNQYDLIASRDDYHANDVYPGLTGWAQVNGRDELSIEIKSKIDGEYVCKMGFWFDLKIIVKTVINVFGGKGVVEGNGSDIKI